MRFQLRQNRLAGLAAAMLCLAPMMTNAADAQSFSIDFGSRGITPFYYNGYGGGSYVPGRPYGYTGYGRPAYGYGSNSLYVAPSRSPYGRSGTSYNFYYRTGPSQGRTYGDGYSRHYTPHTRHYSPYGYGANRSRF